MFGFSSFSSFAQGAGYTIDVIEGIAGPLKCVDVQQLLFQGQTKEALDELKEYVENADTSCKLESAHREAFYGLTQVLEGDIDAGLNTYESAVKCARGLSEYNQDATIPFVGAKIYSHIGQYAAAVNRFEQTAKIQSESGQTYEEAIVYLVLAETMCEAKAYEKALEFLLYAEELLLSSGSKHSLWQVYQSRVKVHIKMNDAHGANLSLAKALGAVRETSSVYEKIGLGLVQAQFALFSDDQAEADKKLDLVQDLLKPFPQIAYNLEYQFLRAQLYKAQKNYKELLRMLTFQAPSLKELSAHDIKRWYLLGHLENTAVLDAPEFNSTGAFWALARAKDKAWVEHVMALWMDENSIMAYDEGKVAAKDSIIGDKEVSLSRYAILLVALLVVVVLIVQFWRYRLKKVSNAKLGHRNQLINEQNIKLRKLNSVLESAIAEAKAGSVAKTSFLAVTSHEIRTPMNGIMGMATLLLDTTLNEEQASYVEMIQTSSENLLGILNDILDFSKIEAGKMSLESTIINVDSLLDSVIALFVKSAKDKNVELKKSVQVHRNCTFQGDLLRLRQILINLVSNAIKFTKNGTIEIVVEAEDLQIQTAESSSYKKLKFSVGDEGVGIEKHNLNKVFDSFEQEDTSTSLKYGGIGLGLSICKKLVELMGGEIGVESEKGKGTTFFFTINVSLADNQMTEIAKPVVAPSQTKSTQKLAERCPLKILIAEDNDFNRLFMERLFDSYGYTDVLFAVNGLQVLKVLEQEQVDMILMDIQMPEMDGKEATREIHKLYGVNSPIIIAVTADAAMAGAMEYQNLGMQGYLSKPFKKEALEEILLESKRRIDEKNLEVK